MSDQTEMYMSLEGQMEALEHHGLLAPGSTALDFDFRSLTFDPELGGYGGDKPKDKSYGRQVWGAMSQAVSTVATSVSEAGSDLYSTVQAAVSSFLNLKADEVLPLRYDATGNFPRQCYPQPLSPCCMGINRLGLLCVQPTGPSLEDTGDHGRTISPPQVIIHLTVYQVSPH